MQGNLAEAKRRIEEARRTRAESLDLGDLELIELPASLGDLPHLKALYLGSARPTETGELEWDDAREIPEFTDLSSLAGLQGLQRLDLTCTFVKNLSPLARLRGLQSLNLSGTFVTDLAPLTQLQRLQSLTLHDCWGVRDLLPLAGLQELQSLDLSGCEVKNLTPLAVLKGLQNLNLSNTTAVDLSSLARLKGLQSLNLRACPRVTDLSPLAGLQGLQSLDLAYCEAATDLAQLAGLQSLRVLNLYGCRTTVSVTLLQIFADHPRLTKLFAGEAIGVPREVLSDSDHDNCLPRLRVYLSEHSFEPEPRFRDATSRMLATKLEACYQREEYLLSAGGDASSVRQEILELRRQLREGGRLQAGDFLGSGRWRLIEPLGRGGFATVWKSFDRQEHRVVALKILHGQFAEDRTRRERFFRGARKMAELHHPGIVHVIEQRVEEEAFYCFVMEYVEGGDLREAVLGGHIAPEAVVPLLQEVAAALIFSHGHGVIHRDVKPANILLDARRHPKLTDFDLVRAVDTTGGTLDGGMLGTFLYTAPEAMSSPQEAGVTADVYSLAMTAAFCLHGADLPAEVLRNAGSFLRKLRCASGAKAVLRKAAAWKPEKRFQSVEEFSKALAESFKAPVQVLERSTSGRRSSVRKRWPSDPRILGMGGTPLTGSEKRREVFISYAWGDETPEGKIRVQVVDALYSALTEDGFLPVRDRDQIRPGERISAFIRRLTRADLVVAVISDKYLRSPYCMYEIYRLWQKCQGDADDLAQRLVPIVLPEVKVGNVRERLPYLEYWADQAESLEALIRNPRLRPSADSWEEVRLVREFAHHVDGILVFLQDVLMPRNLEAHLDDGFQAVRAALRRRMGTGESV